MESKEQKKLIEKIVDNIKWDKDIQGGISGSYILPDGYGVSVITSGDMKVREAKSFIKEELPLRVLELLEERNITIA